MRANCTLIAGMTNARGLASMHFFFVRVSDIHQRLVGHCGSAPHQFLTCYPIKYRMIAGSSGDVVLPRYVTSVRMVLTVSRAETTHRPCICAFVFAALKFTQFQSH